METRALKVLAIVTAAYIACQMMSDIASLRIIILAGLSMDAGTLVYPFTFTLRDLLHKAGGVVLARTVIITAAMINLLMAAMFWLVAYLPADAAVGPQTGFVATLSPVWRIVVASIVAEVCAELVDTEMYRRWVQKFGEVRQWLRVLASNSVAVPLDTAIFCLLAFGGVLPGSVVAAIIVSNIVVKMAVTLLSLPGIYLVPTQPTLGQRAS